MKLVALRNMQLKRKLVISMLLAGVLPLVIASVVIDLVASTELRDQSFAQLDSLRNAKKNQIETYFQQIRNQVQTFSEDTMIINAMNGFRSAFHRWPQEIALNRQQLASMKTTNDAFYSGPYAQEFFRRNQRPAEVARLQPDEPSTVIAQYRYIANNPETLGGKQNLNDAGDGSRYSTLHGTYHPIIKNYLEKFGYYDIFLVDPDTGHIVYSVFKEIDFATSLLSGPFSKTRFALAFKMAAASRNRNAVYLVDFEHYAPSYGGAAAFISSPIFEGNRLAGVLIFQVPEGKINTIMQNHAGMGKTGDTILIGPDNLMRSQSRFSRGKDLLITRFDSDGAAKALRGESGFEIFTEQSGKQVLSLYSPLEIPGLNWAVMAKMNLDEAYAAIDSLHLVIFVTVLISCLCIFAYAHYFASALTQKVKMAANVAKNIASGNFNNEITVNAEDELGEMLTAMDFMQTELFGRMVAEKNEILKIKQAMDSARVNLMICDQDLRITYANPAVVAMLISRESELKNIWPFFDPRKLTGQNMDQFHENPARQRELLTHPANSPINWVIKPGSLEFRLNAVAILDSDGRYVGNMVEWTDITEQVDAERQIESLIENATNGMLDNRLEAERYQGFMHQLAQSVNHMLDAIVTPVQEATRVLETLAGGNLTAHMAGNFNGEFAVMKNAVDTSIATLLKMVKEIRFSADSIKTSANEIAQGNMNLSQRTEAQASSLQQTASSLEQLTSTVRQNADHARDANKLAAKARSEAEDGGNVVKTAIEAMDDINEASRKISEIISVINDIAFQTNLLALNAAVEAARAGDQGRGFAVVAVEVRNLAKRSADAASEIKLLIDDSVEKVEEGSRLVNASGATLDKIVESAKKVSDIIAGIATASHQQAAGIAEINQAVTQMDAMTQQNAALVEQAAAASLSMDEQAGGLSQLMVFFNTGNATAGASSVIDEEKVRKERRRENRPWSNQAHRAPGATSATRAEIKKQPADRPDDSDWEEF